KSNLEAYLNDIIVKSDFLYSDQVLLRNLHRTNESESYFSNDKDMETAINSVLFTRPDLRAVSLYAYNWDRLYVASRERNKIINNPSREWVGDVHERHGFNKEDWSSYSPFNYINNSNDISFTLKRSVYDQFEYIGLLFFDFNANNIKNIVRNLYNNPNDFVILFNENGKVIYSLGTAWSEAENTALFQKLNNDKTELDQIIDKDKKLVQYYKLSICPWTIVKGISYKSLKQDLNAMVLYNALVQIVFIIVGVFIALLLSFRLYRPLYNIIRGINLVKQGNLNFELKVEGGREMESITGSFNQMTRRLHQMIDVEYTMRLNLQQAQLKALQAQINPHFLYNTFQVIGSLALTKGVEEIHEITCSLAKFCRYSIRPDTGLVQLKDEIDHLRNYIRIQELRFSDQLKINFEISDKVWNVKIPKLTLQPIVENSFVHGFNHLLDQAEITISAMDFEDHVLISISDNGDGFSEEDLNHLLSKLEKAGQYDFMHESIGLVNIQERLILHFGDMAKLTIKSIPGEGTRVHFYIPISIEGDQP
ncbi:sensor histidine kinase, partial [Paenibacillus elgii]